MKRQLVRNILAIIGSASSNSAKLKIVELISSLTEKEFQITIFNGLKSLPHFDRELSVNKPPELIVDFRQTINDAEAIIICTPEYVYSIPSGLKNAIEWRIRNTLGFKSFQSASRMLLGIEIVRMIKKGTNYFFLRLLIKKYSVSA